jgi:hypothetical protein
MREAKCAFASVLALGRRGGGRKWHALGSVHIIARKQTHIPTR